MNKCIIITQLIMILHYVLIILTTLYVLIYAYIKIKYPFWNNQPVYHSYDYWRRFYQEPFYIYKFRPIKTKFCNFSNIKTILFADTTEEQKQRALYLLYSNYISNDRILFTFNKENLETLCIGYADSVYLSLYYETHYNLSKSNDHVIIENREPIGCLLSYPANIYFKGASLSGEYSELTLYYMDLLCIHREHNPVKKTRELFQTHEYNQRIKNPSILGSLIKREIELFDGIIPLVEYKTNIYYLREMNFPNLPKYFHVLEINTDNIDILTDFIYVQTHLDLKINEKHYEFISCVSMGNYLENIKKKTTYVYCLKKGEFIFGMYFFKDAKLKYEDLEGDTLHFYGSIFNSNNKELFYLGYMHSLYSIIKKYPGFKIMMFENLGDNIEIHNFWRNKNTPIFQNKTAYYTFNWIYPSSPIHPSKCIFL